MHRLCAFYRELRGAVKPHRLRRLRMRSGSQRFAELTQMGVAQINNVCAVVDMVLFVMDNRIFVENLRQVKRYGARQLIKKISHRHWSRLCFN